MVIAAPRVSRYIWRCVAVTITLALMSFFSFFYGIYRTNQHFTNRQVKANVGNLIPIKECVKGKCYSYTSRDEEYAAYFLPRKEKVNPFNVKYVISGDKICDLNEPPYLLILVPSLHVHVDARKSIRKTWGSMSHGNVWPNQKINVTIKLVFMFGKDNNGNEHLNQMIMYESKIYKDIIFGDFKDNYANLSTKVIMGIHWVSNYCPGTEYILKADDDTFVNIPLLLNKLKSIKHTRHKGVVVGNIYDTAKVHRHGRWEVTTDAYPFPRYPKYASGNTYVFSSNIAPALFKTSEFMPYIPIEDAYITGILSKCVDARHIGIEGFTFWFDAPPKACDFKTNKRISSTNTSPNNMLYIWQRLGNDILKCDSK